MKKVTLATTAAFLLSAETFAGGLLTNTNQNAAFLRNPARDAVMAIDGVYTNPAGVAFLADGFHISLNWQAAFQTRTITNTYAPFACNTEMGGSTSRTFKGKATAPVIPSIQAAFNRKKWSVQLNFAITGGGGKCEFDNGLGSFERIIAQTASGVGLLAQGLDQVSAAYGASPKLSTNYFPNMDGQLQPGYSYDSYMRGRQYYFGLSLAAARRITDNFSVSAGLRGVYASCNYYGYIRDIKVGNAPLAAMLPGGAEVELNCDQNAFGVTPILGADWRTKDGKWNFAAKYEFRTRMRLKNQAVNRTPSLDALPGALIGVGVPAAVFENDAVKEKLEMFQEEFNTELGEAIGEFEDGQKVDGDIPALLTLGAEYAPIRKLRLDAGFHYYFDKQAKTYGNRHKQLDHGTWEVLAGAEYDINKTFTVSAGWQKTQYGITDDYMDDKSFVVSSNTLGLGANIRVAQRVSLDVSYFHTFYKHKKTTVSYANGNGTFNDYTADYTRQNNVAGIGVNISL